MTPKTEALIVGALLLCAIGISLFLVYQYSIDESVYGMLYSY